PAARRGGFAPARTGVSVGSGAEPPPRRSERRAARADGRLRNLAPDPGANRSPLPRSKSVTGSRTPGRRSPGSPHGVVPAPPRTADPPPAPDTRSGGRESGPAPIPTGGDRFAGSAPVGGGARRGGETRTPATGRNAPGRR